jgi:hypothetical protein
LPVSSIRRSVRKKAADAFGVCCFFVVFSFAGTGQ